MLLDGSMQNVKGIELIKLKARAVDSGHLKLATWGTEEELTRVLIDNFADPYQNSDVNGDISNDINNECIEK